MFKKLSYSKVVFILFFLVHILLINVNYAEWGDSYRILRASEYIRNFEYPSNEKRMPLFSVILAMRPAALDQVVWGRVEMLLISIITFYVFSKLLDLYKLEEKTKALTLFLFTFNPVYLYWSLRIMADVPFSLLVISTFYFFKKWTLSDQKVVYLIISAVLTGLAVLMRYEGYILGYAIGMGLIFNKFERKKLKEAIPKYLKHLSIFGFFSLIFVVPWLLYRNPLLSAYLKEPQKRSYDLTMIIIYLSSLFYLFGFTSAFYFIKSQWKKLQEFVDENVEVVTFVVVELVLALMWPAAIPRLFVPIIPLMIIPIAKGIIEYLENNSSLDLKEGFLILASVLLLPVVQYFFRLQFLVLNKIQLSTIILLQISLLLAHYLKKKTAFFGILALSLMVWSFSTIYLHKDIYRTNVLATKYAVKNLKGVVGYNDVNAISDWYLNHKNPHDAVDGVFINLDYEEARDPEIIKEKKIEYLVMTNEHNPNMQFDPDNSDHLEELKEFRYTIGGKDFWTKILKFVE